MKKTFNPSAKNSQWNKCDVDKLYLRIQGCKINFTSQLAQKTNLKIGNYVQLSYDEEIKTIYIEKTEDQNIGFELKSQSKRSKHNCYVYAKNFFDHFQLNGDIKNSYTIENIDENGFKFKFIADKKIITKKIIHRIPFVRLGSPNRLAFNVTAEKEMDLRKDDVVRLYYNPETRIAVIKKNKPQNINGLQVKQSSHKTQSRLYLRSSLMQEKLGWSATSDRMELKRGGAGEDENAFYFEIPKEI
jgi:hypothetical protein